jgi:hypothetical protein
MKLKYFLQSKAVGGFDVFAVLECGSLMPLCWQTNELPKARSNLRQGYGLAGKSAQLLLCEVSLRFLLR